LSKVEEYKRKLEQHEAKQAEKAKLFDPKDLLRNAGEIREVVHPELGVVRYGVLTVGDLLEINKAESNEKRSLLMLWKMLQKATPDLTAEEVERLPMDVAAALLTALTKEAGFLTQTSQAGSPQTQKPKP